MDASYVNSSHPRERSRPAHEQHYGGHTERDNHFLCLPVLGDVLPYVSSSSLCACMLADADSLASSRSRSNSDALNCNSDEPRPSWPPVHQT